MYPEQPLYSKNNGTLRHGLIFLQYNFKFSDIRHASINYTFFIIQSVKPKENKSHEPESKDAFESKSGRCGWVVRAAGVDQRRLKCVTAAYSGNYIITNCICERLNMDFEYV